MLRLSPNITQLPRRKKSGRLLPFPVTPRLRVAQITPSCAAFDAVEVFPCEEWSALEAFSPHVLLGTVADLRRVHEFTQRNGFGLASVDRAVFVVTRCGDQPVDDISRVILWQAFGVPVFELFIGLRGVLLASECDAHEGWHVEPGAHFSTSKGELLVDMPGRRAIATGLTGALTAEICSCGRTGTRILRVEAVPLIRVRRALAATA